MRVEATHPLVPVLTTGVASYILSQYRTDLWIVSPFVGKLTGDWDRGFAWTIIDLFYWITLFLVAYLAKDNNNQ